MREETAGEVFVLTIEGELDLSTADAVREPLEREAEQGRKRVLIDLLDCTFVDSTGLGVILHNAKRLGKGGLMAIACTDEQIRRLLGLTMIDRTIPVFETRDAALAHLNGAPADVPA